MWQHRHSAPPTPWSLHPQPSLPSQGLGWGEEWWVKPGSRGWAWWRQSWVPARMDTLPVHLSLQLWASPWEGHPLLSKPGSWGGIPMLTFKGLSVPTIHWSIFHVLLIIANAIQVHHVGVDGLNVVDLTKKVIVCPEGLVVCLRKTKVVPISIPKEHDVCQTLFCVLELTQSAAVLVHSGFLILTPVGRDLPVGRGSIESGHVDPCIRTHPTHHSLPNQQQPRLGNSPHPSQRFARGCGPTSKGLHRRCHPILFPKATWCTLHVHLSKGIGVPRNGKRWSFLPFDSSPRQRKSHWWEVHRPRLPAGKGHRQGTLQGSAWTFPQGMHMIPNSFLHQSWAPTVHSMGSWARQAEPTGHRVHSRLQPQEIHGIHGSWPPNSQCEFWSKATGQPCTCAPSPLLLPTWRSREMKEAQIESWVRYKLAWAPSETGFDGYNLSSCRCNFLSP